MTITPGPFDRLTEQGELKITEATAHYRSRTEADAVARRLQQPKIEWPADCNWPPEQEMTVERRFWSNHLEKIANQWDVAVLNYVKAGGHDQDLVDGCWESMTSDLRLISDRLKPRDSTA